LFFVAKATISFLLGCTLLGYQGFLVRNLYFEGRELVDQQLTGVKIEPGNCAFTGNARLEPPNGSIMLGFHIDWAKTVPTEVRDQLGNAPAVINAFLRFDPTQQKIVDYDILDWHGQQVRLTGGMLAVTFEPSALDQITDPMIEELAQRCKKINEDYGVPLFVRWGHEMNGMISIM
jgi:hypothetical protein